MSRKKSKNSKFEFDPLRIFLLASVGIAVLLFLSLVKQQQSVLGESFLIARGGDDLVSSENESSNSGSSEVEDESSDLSENNNDSELSSEANDNLSLSSDDDEDEMENEDEFESDLGEDSAENENEKEMRVELTEAQRIRIRSKDGFTRIDLTEGGIKTRFEYKDNKLVIKVELEDESDVELEDEALPEIEERLDDSGLKIATTSGNRFIVQSESSGALSNFPISVDLATNTLFVETPNGSKRLVVLPGEVVQKLIFENVINRIGDEALLNLERKDTASDLNELIELGESNGSTVYIISGISDQKLLGIIPVKVEKTIRVSTENGEIVDEKLSLFDRIQDILSI